MGVHPTEPAQGSQFQGKGVSGHRVHRGQPGETVRRRFLEASASLVPAVKGGNRIFQPASWNSAGAAAGNQAMRPRPFRFGSWLISRDLWEMS